MMMSWRGLLYCWMAFLPIHALGAEVALVGLFPGKAVLIVNGAPPRTVAVGARTPEGVRLLEIVGNAVRVEIDGRKESVMLGQGPIGLGQTPNGMAALSLIPDSRGHYYVNGSINGASSRFLLDTGATMVSIGLSDARRAGINVRAGTPGVAQTANGRATVWRHRLDSVRVGEITLHGVDALVHENDLPVVLLGMSFLNQMDMQREGDRLILRRRY